MIRLRHRWVALAAVVLAQGTAVVMAQVSPGPLSRAHQDLDSLKCLQCHGPANESMDARCLACHTDIAWLIERRRGFHGLADRRTCAPCHPDHAGRDFDLIQWPQGSAAKFDHAAAGLTLEGRHAALECRRCHLPKFVSSELRPLGRHADPARRWTGLDPRCVSCHEPDDVHRGALGPDCARCHGQAKWKPASSFDHAKTAYPLTGRHLPVPCASCHAAERLKLPRDAQGRAVPLYRPVPHRECGDCHTDPHQARLGAGCTRCHVTTDFRTVATAGGFNHGLTRFPLRGGHARVECARCHDPKTAWGKRPVFSACASCHSDPHAGQATLSGRKVDCAACHSEQGWKPSTLPIAQHAATSYPLEGRHVQVACGACHVKNPAGIARASLGTAGTWMRPRHAQCTDCHADVHQGQLAGRPDKGRCEACHQVSGFRPSTFTTVQHAAARLPLQGRHAGISCAACHGPRRPGLPPLPGEAVLGRARVALRLKETACGDCHRDPHGDRFAARAKGPAPSCGTCHDARAFSPSTVDPPIHAKFSFRLEGAHRAVPCTLCHQELAARSTGSSLLLSQASSRRLEFPQSRSRCAECHQAASPHGKQFASRADGGACGGCHGQDTFRSAPAFDHERDAAFSLKGAHARVPCRQCHVTRVDSGGRRQVAWRPIPARCQDCHQGNGAVRRSLLNLPEKRP